MASGKGKKVCCGEEGGGSACRLEGLLGVDERGQMVLPKELRERAGIKPGEKLALVSWERDGKICCLALLKSESVAEMVREMLEPVFASEKK